MSRWLITGAGGQVGAELAVRCPDAVALGHAELDVTDPEAVTELLGRHAPDVVVNAAGWTDVDGAETHVEPAMAANAVGPGLLAAACRGLDATLIHLSSDYVFDGKTSSPYAVDAPANPASAYGRSKLAGERAVLASGARAYVVRTAWVYAAGFSNFVTTMTRLADERETLEVADDQHGQPTWARDLAGALVALGHAELDVTDPEAVTELLGRHAPDVVVNAAGWTDVDGAEAHVEQAMAANAIGPGLLAAACRRLDATLIHLSTDYVFDGAASTPYAVDAPANPASAYGRSKLAGERAVLAGGARAYVVRTAWVYAAGFPNFVTTMTKLAAERETLAVVDDQRGQPTWARDLAGAVVALGDSDAQPGVYHCTNAGETTWCGLARAVFEEIGADPGRVRPTSTEAFPRPAPRPAYSVLSADSWRAAGLPPTRPWRDALAAAFAGSPAAPRQPD
jgi:dTDP-4-dehydrorhamnose reductase